MAQRIRHSGTAHAVLVLLTLLGLLGMHGLPDAMATSSNASAIQTGMPFGMPTGIHGGKTMPAIGSAVHSGSPADLTREIGGAHLTGRPAALESLQHPPATGIAVIPMSCRMDHAGCVAVLRAAAQLPGPIEALPAVAAIDLSPAVPAAIPGRAPRAPPDVSLAGLGISRT